MSSRSIFRLSAVLAVSTVLALGWPPASQATPRPFDSSEVTYTLTTKPVPVTRTFEGRTLRYTMQIVASVGPYSRSVIVTLSKERPGTLQRYEWRVAINADSFTVSQDLSSASLHPSELGDLGTIDLGYTAQRPADQGCDGKVATRIGTIETRTMAFDTHEAAFGVIDEQPQRATLSADSGCIPPPFQTPCPTGSDVEATRYERGGDYQSWLAAAASFDGSAPTAAEEEAIVYTVLGPTTSPAVSIGGSYTKDLRASALPLSDFTVNWPNATVLGSPGSGFVGRARFTSTSYTGGPEKFQCTMPDGSVHTLSEYFTSGEYASDPDDPYGARFDTGAVRLIEAGVDAQLRRYSVK